ncbi:MAG: hypothetical protein Tsb009_27290 [Planctomycetaceae bacterium]
MPTAQQVYSMLDNESIWNTATECHRLLEDSGVPHALCEGVAVCLHGYQRNTIDIDLIIRKTDADAAKTALEKSGMTWDEERVEFRSAGGVAVQFLYSGEPAGRGAEVSLPEPEGDLNVETVEGLSVLRLSKLIEIKIACGLGNLRRTHKDFADVVELIDIRKLDSSFARYLHKSVRKTYRELVKNAQSRA